MIAFKTHFAHPELLWAFVGLPILVLMSYWAAARRRHAVTELAGLSASLMARKRKERWGVLRRLCLTLGLSLVIVGSAGPRWGLEPEQTAPGRDLIAVLDCSRSMLAEQPTRLERGRRALLNLITALKQHGGHRIALVAFAAHAKVVCPLTRDYDHFLETLGNLFGPLEDSLALARRIEALDIGPKRGDVSGTRLGAGIDEALQIRDQRFLGITDILFISDGDDPARDREWYAAAARARARGVPIYTLGFGDPDSDSMLAKSLLRPDETPFTTRLTEAPLQEIAEVTQGRYIPAHDTAVPLGAIYLDSIATRTMRDDAEDTLVGLQPRYVWFLLPAFLLLACSIMLRSSSVRGRGV